jgi:adenosylcobinamide-GDP ribazoletransferase
MAPEAGTPERPAREGPAPRELRLFLTAVQYFTRVPVPAWVGHSAEQLNGSARYFPAVGLCIGLYAAAVYTAAAYVWNPVIAALLATAATVLATGAFHEDGLADTFDALGGAMTRERALEIMKDSRIGTYGALALLLVLAIKVAALASSGLLVAVAALPAAHAVSRWLSTSLIWRSQYVRIDDSSRAKPVTQSLSTAGFVVASLWALPALVCLGVLAPLATCVALCAAGSVRWWLGGWFERRLGGYTGDTLGATQQLTEAAFYLGLLATWKSP